MLLAAIKNYLINCSQFNWFIFSEAVVQKIRIDKVLGVTYTKFDEFTQREGI